MKLTKTIRHHPQQQTPSSAHTTWQALRMIAIIAPTAFVNYSLVAFIPILLTSHYHLGISVAILSTVVIMSSLIGIMYLMIIFLKHKSITAYRMLFLVLFLIFSIPISLGIMSANPTYIILSIFGLTIFSGCYTAPMLYTAIDSFSKRNKLKLFGTCYNLSYVIFGATAPLINQFFRLKPYTLGTYIATLIILAIIAAYYERSD